MLIEERIKTTLEDCEALQKAVSSLIDNLAYLMPAPQKSTDSKVPVKPKAALEIIPEPHSPAENDLELLQSRLRSITHSMISLNSSLAGAKPSAGQSRSSKAWPSWCGT